MVLERKKRHFERYLEIGRILARHGWESLASRLGASAIFSLRRRRAGPPPAPVQVRETLEELGPTFIKLGQLLSTRPDIIPGDYISELEKLQDETSPVPVSEIRKVIESEFGAPLESIFTSFDEEPLASASLGQTHLAVLPDRSEVVVKVQRPGIERAIETDLEILAGIARFLEQHFEWARTYRLADLVEEFSVTLRQELDYTREGRNGDRLKQNLSSLPFVRVASTVWEYTTPRVLTAERVCGVKITDLEALAMQGYDARQIAKNLSRAYLKMVFVDGFFHGDPHPGNIVVLENNAIGLLDYGMVGQLQGDLKTYITMLFASYLDEDSAGFADVLLAMGRWPSSLDRKAFQEEIDRLLRQYYGIELRSLNIGEILNKALRISARFRVSLPSNLALLIKVIISVEGIDRVLDPEYNFAHEARPYILQSVRNEFSIVRLRDQLVKNLIAWKMLVLGLPNRATDLLDRLSEGRFRIVFRHEGLEGPIRDIDKSANRLSFALISSATIVASALILSSGVGPLWRGYPLFGLVGFVIAFVFAVWLMVSIIRAGKMW